MDGLHGFPYWQVNFDADAQHGLSDDEITLLTSDIGAQKLTDLFIFSHGWNTTRTGARRMYDRYFRHVRHLLDQEGFFPAPLPIGVMGVTWPSILWPDDDAGVALDGGLASMETDDVSEAISAAAYVRAVKSGEWNEHQRGLLEQIAVLLDPPSFDAKQAEGPPSPQAERAEQDQELPLTEGERLEQIWKRLDELVHSVPDDSIPEEDEEILLHPEDAELLAEELAAEEPVLASAAAGESPINSSARGVKKAVRLATFLTMKRRSGHVGKAGLAPLLTSIYDQLKSSPGGAAPRLHLAGHSFGARLVSFAAHSMDEDSLPLTSLVLLQAAFSRNAFAPALPHAPNRAGALAGLQERVSGPIIVTHSTKDTALGGWYATGAMMGGLSEAAQVFDWIPNWGSLGHTGAEGVTARDIHILEEGADYQFAPNTIVNLNCNQVIRKGDGPEGAHSDIYYPSIAWMTLAAAGLTQPTHR